MTQEDKPKRKKGRNSAKETASLAILQVSLQTLDWTSAEAYGEKIRSNLPWRSLIAIVFYEVLDQRKLLYVLTQSKFRV